MTTVNSAAPTLSAPTDAFVRRARPGFLYVMYALILLALPIGLVAAISPATAATINHGIAAYLRAIPEPLYALFGTGYLGSTAGRQWGKIKGFDQ